MTNLMIIDTEGLKGMEKMNTSSHHHDNELATFAIGLANLTVININGEDQSDMHDILQITIYALIRMKEVELNPKCIFTHQNVLSDNADEKLMTQRNRLVRLLNDMTFAAATQEGLTHKYNRFSDVIGFDLHNDVLYFSGLLQGEPPMAPINLGYCLDAEEARKTILNQFKNSTQFYKLQHVGKRIDEVWSCIMKEDFVFHFRNVLELNVTLELEMELAKWESNYTQTLTTWECRELNVLSNLSLENLEDYWTKLTTQLGKEVDSICRTQQQELLENFFENHKLKDILINRQNDIKEHFEEIRSRQYNNILKNFQKVRNNVNDSQYVDKYLNEVENQLLQDIMELYKVHKKQAEEGQLNDEMIDNIFLEKWNEFAKDFPTQTNRAIDIKQELQNFFHSTETLRSVNFTEKNKIIGNIGNYQEFGSKQEFLINKNLHYTKIRKSIKIEEKLQKMSKKQHIGCYLANLQNECQQLIDLSFTTESNFSENAFKWILELVDEQVSLRNKDNIHVNTRERNYNLTKNLVHDFSFYQCCRLIPQFEKMQNTFLERNSIRNKVESKKEQFKTYFFSLWKGVQNEQCAANELATLVFNSIADSVHQLMERNIITVFKEHTNQFETKYEIQVNCMIHLCEKENFDSYLKYIQDPVEYIRMKLEQRIHEVYATDERRRFVLQTYDQHVTNLIAITNTAALEALNHSKMGISANEQDICEIPKGDWKKIFLELIKSYIPNVTNKKLIIFDAYEIKDYSAFIKSLNDSLLEKQKENTFVITREYKSLSEEMLKEIILCRECCPFCNELCQRNLGRHEHYCGVFHRPLGLRGIKNSSNKLVSQPCPAIFRLNTKKIGNLDFSEGELKTKNWKIKERKPINTHHWIWVMNRFSDQFEAHYGGTFETKIQPLLTKDDILRELRDGLNTVDTSNFSHGNDKKTSKFSLMVRNIFSFLFSKKKTIND